MEIDLKKMAYIAIAILLIGVVTVNVVNPIITKIKNQKSQIESIDFTGGTNP